MLPALTTHHSLLTTHQRATNHRPEGTKDQTGDYNVLYAFFVMADLIPIFVFVGIVALIWSILSMISQRNTRSMERLARLSRPPSLAEVEAPQSKAERFAGLIDAAKSLSSPL